MKINISLLKFRKGMREDDYIWAFVSSKRLKTPQLEKHGAYLLITEHLVFLLFHRWKGFALTVFRSVPGQCQQYRGQAGGFQSQVITGSSDGAGRRGELTNLISYLSVSWLCVSHNGFLFIEKTNPCQSELHITIPGQWRTG